MTPRRRTVVALAGAAVNATLAVILLVVTAAFADASHVVFWSGMAFLGFLQVTAVVLNLLPIPGLDGYGALEPHLSPETQRALQPAKQWGFVILFILLIAPPLNQAFFSIVYRLFEVSGVNPGYVALGSNLTRFWSAWF
jgi:Zn-dependent protease